MKLWTTTAVKRSNEVAVMRKLLLMIALLCFATNGWAQEQGSVNAAAAALQAPVKHRETLKEKLIGTFVKTFAKTYIASHNLEKFKQKNIKKVLKMDEAKFQRVYKKIYKEMIIDLPEHLKDMYGVTEYMTRDKAVERINAFKTKRDIYRMINALPNKMIAQHFKKHKKEFNQTMKKNGSGVDGMVDQLLADPAAS